MQALDSLKSYEQLFSTGDETSSSDDNSEIKDVVKEAFNIASSGGRNISVARLENFGLKIKSYLSLLVVVFFLCNVIMPFVGYKYECDLLEEKFYM